MHPAQWLHAGLLSWSLRLPPSAFWKCPSLAVFLSCPSVAPDRPPCPSQTRGPRSAPQTSVARRSAWPLAPSLLKLCSPAVGTCPLGSSLGFSLGPPHRPGFTTSPADKPLCSFRWRLAARPGQAADSDGTFGLSIACSTLSAIELSWLCGALILMLSDCTFLVFKGKKLYKPYCEKWHGPPQCHSPENWLSSLIVPFATHGHVS